MTNDRLDGSVLSPLRGLKRRPRGKLYIDVSRPMYVDHVAFALGATRLVLNRAITPNILSRNS